MTSPRDFDPSAGSATSAALVDEVAPLIELRGVRASGLSRLSDAKTTAASAVRSLSTSAAAARSSSGNMLWLR